ncbi:MAG: nucleic acid-binding protein [Deltaproteobacteria bacterium]|nr:nucleic acid-binding protein [Deltaproteobacteria bacterium]
MRLVFADTLYWVAIVRPGDQWADAAKRARAALGPAIIVTTDEVLTEFLTSLAAGGEQLRRQAVRMVRAIMENPNVRVLPQSRDSFLRGVDLYGQRLDKQYSLTDCVSMNAMSLESVTEVLANDHHFAQEGFTVLMPTKEPE